MRPRHRRALATAFVLAVGLCGCAGPHPVLLEGDANSARIAYSGDRAATAAVAQKHCEAYARVARFRMADMDTAFYDCVEPKR